MIQAADTKLARKELETTELENKFVQVNLAVGCLLDAGTKLTILSFLFYFCFPLLVLISSLLRFLLSSFLCALVPFFCFYYTLFLTFHLNTLLRGGAPLKVYKVLLVFIDSSETGFFSPPA